MINNFLNKEYNTRDFPFYNNNPRIPKHGWLILFLSIFLSFLGYMLVYDYSEILAEIIQVLIMFVPLLYYSKGNYQILMHKPDGDELTLAFIMFISYIIYAIIMISVLELIGLGSTGSVTAENMVTLETYVSLIFAIMSEELLKFIPLMFFMRLFYKYSNNRSLSFILSSLIMLVGFGLLHYNGDLTIYSVLLIQGLGTIFEIYGYYKTKNLLVPYLSHLLTDLFLMGLMFLSI